MKTNIINVDTWLEEDNLLLLESWTRDGYTMVDIANRIGITRETLYQWKRKYPEIATALANGKEIVDYKVENALLKSALGYQTKEVKVTTTMRYGKVVETIKEVTEKEQAPNISAIQTWLYNRCKDKWRNMNAKQNMFEGMEEDDTVEIIVRRASADETNGGSDSETNENTADGIIEEKDIVLRKRTDAEVEEKKKQKAAKKRAETIKEKQHTVVSDKNDEQEIDALDEWPEDWVDEDGE